MKIQEARDLGDQISALILSSRIEDAYALLSPLLLTRTPFRLLDAIGAHVRGEAVNAFLDRIGAERTEGGWVVIASALRQQIGGDLAGAFGRCRGYVAAADVWYGTDIFGERVPGPALVTQFDAALVGLAPWREDPDRWIRRMVGVAVHYWTKQAHGAGQYLAQVGALLDLLAPMFTEKDTDVVKGVGWGLKTLGRYYPEPVCDWLVQQSARPHRALMMQKATTYFPAELRQRVLRGRRSAQTRG
jgi:hypothetical protein